MKTNLAQINSEEYRLNNVKEVTHIHVHVEQEEPKLPWYKTAVQQETLYQMLLSVLTFFVLMICCAAFFDNVNATDIMVLSNKSHNNIPNIPPGSSEFSEILEVSEVATVSSFPKTKNLFEDKCLAPILGLGLSLSLMMGYHWFKWGLNLLKKEK